MQWQLCRQCCCVRVSGLHSRPRPADFACAVLVNVPQEPLRSYHSPSGPCEGCIGSGIHLSRSHKLLLTLNVVLGMIDAQAPPARYRLGGICFSMAQRKLSLETAE
jgi:hypothetical protein